MADFDDLNDDLSDLLGSTAPVAPRQLPQDPQLVRAREAAASFTETCPKCGGRGRFISYAGRDCGPCFACKGKGKQSFRTSPEARAQARQRTQDAKQATREEFKAQIEWLQRKLQSDRLPEGYRTMLQDFLAKLSNGNSLSGDLEEGTGQLGVIARGMERDAQWAAEREMKRTARVAEAPVLDASKIVAAIQSGKASGLLWVNLNFAGIRIEEAKKHPGTLYVKAADKDRTYLGKIVDSRYLASRVETGWFDAHVFAYLQAVRVPEVATDPFAAAKVYGNVSGRCCVCNALLTNKQSINEGIGPICGDRVGWTKGGIRVQVQPTPGF